MPATSPSLKSYIWCKSKREPRRDIGVKTRSAARASAALSFVALKHATLTSGGSSTRTPHQHLAPAHAPRQLITQHTGQKTSAECAHLHAGREVPHTVPASAALPDRTRTRTGVRARARTRSCSGICPGSRASCLGICTCTPAPHRAADLHRPAQVPAGGAARANAGCFSAQPGVQPGVHVQQQRSRDPCRPGHHI